MHFGVFEVYFTFSFKKEKVTKRKLYVVWGNVKQINNKR